MFYRLRPEAPRGIVVERDALVMVFRSDLVLMERLRIARGLEIHRLSHTFHRYSWTITYIGPERGDGHS